ncbi:A1S_2505 family phage non-structural protein [Noviherbaspirillum galbum]|uniref:Macro domain-containing protein n=1 Tax=Noviherbaspirillum galbum TaxID=2709383 RepID=A0A6B3SHH7_9BURK|nr:hypothetical protein [Noviherbaspirillum galbum]NEX60118.1 hypothetical protein [Noviherbaspirillum galbum]
MERHTKIFVFGSNLAGRHGKGAALFARQYHGAINGKGEGFQGASYAIPTKNQKLESLPLEQIKEAANRFKAFAATHPEMLFQVTPIGCGLAGYVPVEIAPMFEGCPDNCELPDEFRKVLERQAFF